MINMPEPQALANAFEFARALRDPQVRAEISKRGYISGTTVVVGQDTPVHHDATFRVWRDDTVPGGWTGCPINREEQP